MTSPEPSPTLGHESIRERLFRVSRARLLPSTYLFCGPDGVGKRRISLEWARSLLCTGDPADIHDRCPSCLRFETSTVSHPDISFLKPESEGETIRIDPAREFLSSLSSPPLIGLRRMGLVDDAHRLTHEASNALLKTLEDPPEDTILILLTHIPDALLPTIRSRCLSIRFNPVPSEKLAPLLDRLAPGMSPVQRRALLFLSRGAPGKLSQTIESGDRELLERILGLLSGPTDDFLFDSEVLQSLSTPEGFTLFLDTFESLLESLYRRDAGLKCDPLFEGPGWRPGELSSLPPLKRELFHDRVQHLRTLQIYNINRGLAIEELLWDWRDTLISLKTRP